MQRRGIGQVDDDQVIPWLGGSCHLFLHAPYQQPAIDQFDAHARIAQFSDGQRRGELLDSLDEQGVQLGIVYAFQWILEQFLQDTPQAAAQYQCPPRFRDKQHRQVDNLFAQSHVRHGCVQDRNAVGKERVLPLALGDRHVAIGRILRVEQVIARPLLADSPVLDLCGQWRKEECKNRQQ